MYKNVLFLLFIILSYSKLSAQDWNAIYYLEGEAQYQVEEREYDKAVDIYKKMIKEIPENSLAKYKVGQLYLLTDDQKTNAIPYLEEASQDIALDFNEKSLREIRTPVDVLLYLGQAYQIAGRNDEAKVVYNNFKNLIKPDNDLYPLVIQRLATCENAKKAIKNPLRVSIKDIGKPVNNDDSNFGAVFSGDGNTMIYTSYTRNYIDIYSSQKENNTWSTPKKITDKVSSKYYLKTSSLSYDGTQLYLVTDEPEENDIFVNIKEGKNWTKTEKLDKNINEKKSNETHACVSKDGNTLYFTSDRDGGLGKLDIYKSTKDAKGKWGEAENLGPNINTKFNENTPFITADGKYLFFSSEGHNSIGGYDIFYVDLSNNSEATNLGYPANTTGDDLFFVPDNSISAGYISKYDSTSLGKNDIYYISILPKIYLAGDLKNNVSKEIISDDQISISINDSKTNELIKTADVTNGKFNLKLNPGLYKISVQGSNYEPLTKQINIPKDYSEQEFPFEASLNPIVTEQPELVAETTEAPTPVETKVETPTVEETSVEQPVVEEVAQEPVKEEPEVNVPEEKIVEKPKEKEVVPEKKIVKYIPKTSTAIEGKTYSVQLMALKVPVDISYFKDVDGVQLKKYEDGFYRYTVGMTISYTEAQELKEKINKIGYKDAFIRINGSAPRYTIQLMALIIPVELDYFKNLSSVVVTKGADDFYRYTIGDYNDYNEAKQELSNLKSLGYDQVFIKRMN